MYELLYALGGYIVGAICNYLLYIYQEKRRNRQNVLLLFDSYLSYLDSFCTQINRMDDVRRKDLIRILPQLYQIISMITHGSLGFIKNSIKVGLLSMKDCFVSFSEDILYLGEDGSRSAIDVYNKFYHNYTTVKKDMLEYIDKFVFSKTHMKKYLILSLAILISPLSFAQSYNTENAAWANYLVRMYENAPFEGVRVVDDYTSQHLISVLSLDKGKYANESTMNRVATVKAMSQASRFFNGSTITDDLIIKTSEKSDGSSNSEVIENITEHSSGYVKSLQHLTNFSGKDNQVVFIFSTEIKGEN